MKLKIKRNSLTIFLIVFFLFFVSLSSYITSAFLVTNEYKMRGEVTTGGHVNLTNINTPNITKIAVGQPIIGITKNDAANFRICFGVFCTGIYQPQYSMNFSGMLNYSNGSFVKNAPIKVTVRNATFQYEGKNWTDSQGRFFVKIEKLPEELMGKDLDITIFVQSDIEAVYNCWYNHTSTKCCKKPVTQPCV